jgi:hypothetical protein
MARVERVVNMRLEPDLDIEDMNFTTVSFNNAAFLVNDDYSTVIIPGNVSSAIAVRALVDDLQVRVV